MSQPLSIRLPDELSENLELLSRSLDRPKSYLIRKAIESYLADYADYQIAIDRLHDMDDNIISSEDMKKKFGL